MIENLTEQTLDKYLVKNGGAYHKYLKKFNKKGRFLSLNWFALLLPFAWLPYRKLWLPYGVLFLQQAIILVLAYILSIFIGPKYLEYIIIAVIVMLASTLVYSLLSVNFILLSKASKGKEGDIAKSHWLVVLVSSIIFFLPAAVFAYKATYPDYLQYKDYISHIEQLSDKKVEFKIGGLEPSFDRVAHTVKESGDIIYLEDKAILGNEQLVKAQLIFEGGYGFLTLQLTPEGREILSKETQNNIDGLLLMLADSEIVHVIKINEKVEGSSLQVRVDEISKFSELVNTINKSSILESKHENFLSWFLQI